MKPGGSYLARTPNKWHYMSFAARVTPTWFYKFFNRLRGREMFDPFRTMYKLNSKHDVENYVRRVGFKVRRIEIIEGRPEYLRV